MPSKTIAWIVALVVVTGLAILVGRRAGRNRGVELSSNQSVPLSEFPRVSETTIYLDGAGFPTGAVSTSSTSTLPPDSFGSNGTGPG